MKAEEVLLLVKAGYTKEEISAMEPSKEAEVKPTTEAQPEAPKEQEDVKKNSSGSEDALKAEILSEVTKLIQAKNRDEASFEAPKEQTVDSIFKDVFGGELEK